MTRSVLAAIVPGPEAHATAALGQAVAHLLGAPLVLGAVVGESIPIVAADGGMWPGDASDGVDARDRLIDELTALAASLPGTDEAAVDVAWAPTIASGIADLGGAHDAQVIVLAQRHRKLLARILDGDPVVGLTRHADCSVLFAEPAESGDETELNLATVGVAWNRSPEAASALAVAVDLARRADAALHVIHVLQPEGPLFVPPANPVLGRELITLRRKEASTTIRQEIAERAPDLTVETLIVEGLAGAALAHASRDLDLLVVGSRCRGPLRRVAVGSVSTHLLHHAACPVLVVPREDRHQHGSATPVASEVSGAATTSP